MKRLRWQILVVALALVAIAVLLLLQQPTIIQQVAQQTQPATGGTYTEAVIGSPQRFNPLLAGYNSADQDITRLVFSGLMRFDSSGLPQVDLAESWGFSQDFTVYNFSIRADAVWHDGQPVTSEDVLFTVDLMRDAELPTPEDVRSLWDQVEVKILDEKTIQFRLPEPFSPFLDYMTFGVLPRHLLASVASTDILDAPFNLKPVGSGPFKFERVISSDGQLTGVELSAFPEYYATRPFIDTFILRFYPDADAALTAYEQGEVQGVSQVPDEELQRALRIPTLNLYTGRLPQLSVIFFNLDHPTTTFFQDASLRRALLMGINRQWLIDHVLNGQALVADGPIFPGTWAYYEDIEHLGYDSERALELIKAAGYTIPAEGGSVRSKDGVAFSFELAYPADAQHTALFEAIRRDWAKLGVEVTPKPVTYEELINDHLGQRTYQAALVDLNLMGAPDPDPYPFWHQAQITGGQNYAGWNDRQASEYLERGRVTVDLAERARAYRNFQVRFTQEMPALPLYYPVYSYAVDEQVQGVGMGPLFTPSDRFATVTGWFLKSTRQDAPTATATAPVATP
jgi:peptide/nickel transport system substrate-binding protein